MKAVFVFPIPLVSSRVTTAILRFRGGHGKHITCRNRPPVACVSTSADAQIENDIKYMRLALQEARKAYDIYEVPIGAILIDGRGQLISKAHNEVETAKDCTKHAEMICLQQAMKAQMAWRLTNCVMYCTLEPCAMCLSALALARVSRIVYAAPDLRLGACGSWFDLSALKHPFHSFSDISSGVLADESASLLRQFFKERRADPTRIPS